MNDDQRSSGWARPLAAALLSLAIAACGGGGGTDAVGGGGEGGGGGGGGGTGGGGGVPTTPADPTLQPLALTAETMADAAVLAPGAGEVLLLVGQLAVDLSGRFAAAGSAPSVTEACPNGGLLTLAWDDRNADARVSAGDRITADLKECGVPLWNEVLSGSLTVAVDAAGNGAGDALRGTLTIDAGGLTVVDYAQTVPSIVTLRLMGSLAFDWTHSDVRSALAVSSTAADDLRLVVSGNGLSFTESLRAATVSRVLQRDQARAVVGIALRYESQVLGGTLTVSTPQPLQAYLNTYPEAGRLEVRGRGAAVLRLAPHFVLNSRQFDAALDADGDGKAETTLAYEWSDVTAGYLWWDGRSAPAWSYEPYSTTAFSTTGFSYRLADTSQVGVDGKLWLQFTRPPAGTTALQFRFRDDGSTLGYDWNTTDVAAEVVQHGALYLVRAAQPLRHARRYVLQVSADGGATWTSSVPVYDALGNQTFLPSNLGQITVPDSMRAVVAASGLLLSTAQSSVTLDAGPSISRLRPIASYRWKQVDGTPLVFGTPDAAVTTVRWSAPPAALEKVVVELTIADALGESETTRVTLNSVNAAASQQLLYFRSTAGDYIGAGQSFVADGSVGRFTMDSYANGRINLYYMGNALSEWWILNLGSADGQPLRVGAYENASRFGGTQPALDFSGSGRGCNGTTGRFDVHEIGTDASGRVDRLALDFEQHCDGPQKPPLFGSLRINSSVPIRP